jgi:hypothetical protein
MNVKFRKLGWIEWRWLGVFIAPTTILVVVDDGAPDSLVVHRTGHCSVSGACHVSCPLGFGAVGHWSPLSCSCTGQSYGTPDMSAAFWLFAMPSALCAFTVHVVDRWRTGDRCSVGSPDMFGAHRTIRWIIAERPLEKPESGQFTWCSAWAPDSVWCATGSTNTSLLLQTYLSPQLNFFLVYVEPYAPKIHDN